MRKRTIVTEFAPAERVPIKVIERQHKAVVASPSVQAAPASAPDFVLILNQQRQIVFASRSLEALLPERSLDSVLGLRAGEALDCVHARELEGGCGTAAACRDCGLIQAILASLEGRKAQVETSLTRVISLAPTALDLLVSAVPFECRGEHYAFLSISRRAGTGGKAG
jgi:hypothetical protein